MAEDLDDGEFWLPSQFLTDDEEEDHHHLLMKKIHSIRFGSYGVTASPLLSKRPSSPPIEPATTMMMSSTTLTKRRDDDDDDRENHLTRPTCQIPHSKQKERVIMSGSPKSPLCDIGNWSAFSSCSSSGGGGGGGGGGSSRGSPICSSLVSSPPSSTPLQNVKQEDPLDVLNAAAGQIGRLKMNDKEEEEGQHRHNNNNNHHSDLLLRRPPPPPSLEITTPVSSSKVKNLPKKLGLFSNEALIQQQLQNAHQFQQLKQQQPQQQSVLQQQQQLLRQQLSAAWGWQRKVVPPTLPPPQQQQQQQQVQSSKRCARPLGMASSLHQQQGSGTSKESCGTGVFIPRRRSIPTAETPKKPAGCPAVLVPAKVVQAPNLCFIAMGGDTGGVLTSNEHVKCSSPIQQTRTASDAVILSGQQHHPQNVASHEICLPKEWTY